MKLIKAFKEITKSDTAIAGGKGASLGEMTQAGIPVPEGFVIISNAFDLFIEGTDLNVEIDAVLNEVDNKAVHTVENASEKIQAMILSKEIPKNIETKILQDFKKLDCKFVAVRSSATLEDSASAAWAGQLDSFLNTTEKTLLENVKKCWASLFTPRAIFYRFEKKLHRNKVSVAVVVQKMIQSKESGVAFSVHPVTEDENQIIIEAGFGLGEAIVSGSITPDSYVIDKQGFNILDINVNEQTKALYKKARGGNEWKELGEKGKTQVLTKKEVIELSKLIVKIENHYGFPCDIEWAKENSKFYIVQSRPITTLKKKVKQKTSSKALKEWFLVENIPNSDIFFFQIPFSCFVNNKSYNFIDSLNTVLAVFNGFHMDFYMEKNEAFCLSEDILKKIINKPNFGSDINKKILLYSKKLKRYSEKLKSLNLSIYSNKQLWDLYEEHDAIHTKLYTYGWYPVQVDMLFNNFTKELKKYLMSVCKDELEVEHFFIILTTPSEKTIIAKEREEFFNLYKKFKSVIHKFVLTKNKSILTDDFTNAVKKFREKWGHLGYIYAGNNGADLFSVDHYIEELVNIDNSEKTVDEMLNIESVRLEKTILERNAFFKNKKTPELHKRLFMLARDYALSKLVRRDAQLYALYQLHYTLLDEIAKRLKIKRKHVQFMLMKEVHNALIKNKIDKNVLDKRTKNCVYLINRKGEFVYVGKKASRLKSEIKEEINFDCEEFAGQVAQPGYARGTVKLVIRASDMNKMNKGDILVSIATDPDIVPAMKKAAAIITDQGGITSHAAIVSREMGIPCVIGTKIGSRILKDNDFVEVDANKGIIRILEKKKFTKYTIIAKDFQSPLIRNEIWTNLTTFWKKWYGFSIPSVGIFSNKNSIEYFVNLKEWVNTKEKFQEKISKNPLILKKVIDQSVSMGVEMNKFTSQLLDADLANWTPGQMTKFYKKFCYFQSREYAIGVLLPLIDIHGVSFLESFLKDYLSKNLPKKIQYEAYTIFTSPIENSFAMDQEMDLLLLADELFQSEECKSIFLENESKNIPSKLKQLNSIYYNKLKEHAQKHGWVYYVYAGPAFGVTQFAEFLKEMLNKGIDPKAERNRKIKERKNLIKKRKEYLKKLNPTKNDKIIIELVSTYVLAKPRRKDYQSRSYHHLEKFYVEVAKRLNTTLELARSSTQEQIYNAILAGKIDKEKLKEQYKKHLCYTDNNKVVVLSGNNAQNFADINITQEKFEIESSEFIMGNTAFSGKAKGIVKVINDSSTMEKMESGNILVSVATTPNIVPAMKKASAIITDEGGLTCHAAIVSRELEVPCVVGTKFASKVLKDGDLVEVDANKGIIRIIKKKK